MTQSFSESDETSCFCKFHNVNDMEGTKKYEFLAWPLGREVYFGSLP
jgi:hypothetical protein